jgi:hypothetical protein
MSGVTMEWTDTDGSGWFANTYRSDPSKKKNIARAGDFDSLAALRALPIWEFDWKADDAPHVPHGLLSTDIRAVGLLDCVMVAPDRDEHMNIVPDRGTDHVDPQALMTHMIRAIQQLAARVDAIH